MFQRNQKHVGKIAADLALRPSKCMSLDQKRDAQQLQLMGMLKNSYLAIPLILIVLNGD